MQTYFAILYAFIATYFSLKVALQNDKIIPLYHTTQILTKLRICQIKPSATSLQLDYAAFFNAFKCHHESPKLSIHFSSQDTFISVYSLCFGDQK